MSYISGVLTEDSRIILYDTGTSALIYDQVVSAGAYSIDDLSGDVKHIMAVNEATGQAVAYGDVVPAGSPTLLVDNFDGLSLDTGNWIVSGAPNYSVTVNEELRLNNATGSSHSGAHVRTVSTWSKSLAYEIKVKWKPHTDHYGSAAAPYIAFVNSGGYSPSSTYGDPQTNLVRLNLSAKYDSTNRTEMSLNSPLYNLEDQQAVAAININEALWHDIVFNWNPTTRSCWVKLNGSQIMSIGQGGLGSVAGWSAVRVMMGSCDYNKTNTERFDNFVLNYA